MDKTKSNKNIIIDYCIFALCVIAVAIITFILFNNQAVYGVIARQTDFSVDLYHSDMYAYMQEMQGLDSGYSFPYPVFFKLSALFNLVLSPEHSVALATCLLNVLAIIFTKLSLNNFVLNKEYSDKKDIIARVVITLASVALFFVSMMIPPFGIYMGTKFRCVGIFSSNPFQNATYMAARPFAIVSFVYFCKLLGEYEEGWKGKYKDYIIFAVAFLLLTMTKPSFTLVLGAAAVIIILVRFFIKKCKTVIPSLQLALCFVPTILDLLYQYKGVFTGSDPGTESGIGFCFGDIWMQYTNNIFSSVFLAMGFPILMLILNFKALKTNERYAVAWICYIVSFLMAFCCYEKGSRAVDFNFSWSYMYGIFFTFFASVEILIAQTIKGERKILTGISWVAFLYHLISGIYFFSGIFAGGTYY